jgi:hypothetical protein
MPTVVLARLKIERPHSLNALWSFALLWAAVPNATAAFLPCVQRWIGA